jgi:hypothetical protein
VLRTPSGPASITIAKAVTKTLRETYFCRRPYKESPTMIKSDFSQILDAASTLPLDAREELIEILHKRTIEQRRVEIARDIKNARAEHKRGKAKATRSADIMKELLS